MERGRRPVRIQMRRTKGFRLQEVSRAINGLPAVLVSRPTKFGNPFNWRDFFEDSLFILNERSAKRKAVETFRDWLEGYIPNLLEQRRMEILESLPEIRGKNLACWCKEDEPCHADVLLELANRDKDKG